MITFSVSYACGHKENLRYDNYKTEYREDEIAKLRFGKCRKCMGNSNSFPVHLQDNKRLWIVIEREAFPFTGEIPMDLDIRKIGIEWDICIAVSKETALEKSLEFRVKNELFENIRELAGKDKQSALLFANWTESDQELRSNNDLLDRNTIAYKFGVSKQEVSRRYKKGFLSKPISKGNKLLWRRLEIEKYRKND